MSTKPNNVETADLPELCALEHISWKIHRCKVTGCRFGYADNRKWVDASHHWKQVMKINCVGCWFFFPSNIAVKNLLLLSLPFFSEDKDGKSGHKTQSITLLSSGAVRQMTPGPPAGPWTPGEHRDDGLLWLQTGESFPGWSRRPSPAPLCYRRPRY